MIVTSNDVGLEVKCNYNLSNRTVSHNADLEVGGELPGATNAEQTIVQAPNVTMRITDRYVHLPSVQRSKMSHLNIHAKIDIVRIAEGNEILNENFMLECLWSLISIIC